MKTLPTIIPSVKKVLSSPSRYKVIYGGRASGKSYSIASHLIILTSNYKLKVMCIRQFQNNIKESVYTLLKDVIYANNLQDEYEILQSTIKHKTTKSEFIFYGIARNVDEVKSTEGVDILYSEESHALTQAQWEVINPTIRKEYSEIYLVFNPQNRSDYIWQRFVEHKPKDCITLKLNYEENPYLSKTMLKVINEAKEEDFEEFEHIYLGKPREGDDKALFTFSEIEDAMNGNLDGVDKSGIFTYSADVARYGNDKSVTSKRRGYQIYDLKTYKGYSTMEYANQISSMYLQETDKKPNAIFVDTIGVGAGVFDRLDEKGFNSIEANVSMKADETDVYYNKRAEMYFKLRDFLRKGGKIPNDDDLKEELLAIRYAFNNANGKIIIQPKDDIKELIGRSPDKSDSVAMHFFSDIRIEKSDFATMQKKRFRRR